MPKSSLLKSDSPRQTISSKAYSTTGHPPILTLKKADIIDVWGENLEEEMSKITELIEAGYNIIAVVSIHYNLRTQNFQE